MESRCQQPKEHTALIAGAFTISGPTLGINPVASTHARGRESHHRFLPTGQESAPPRRVAQRVPSATIRLPAVPEHPRIADPLPTRDRGWGLTCGGTMPALRVITTQSDLGGNEERRVGRFFPPPRNVKPLA
jgi:hypothetical protein